MKDLGIVCLQMVIALINVIDIHIIVTLFSFFDPAKIDANKILDSIGLNKALITDMFLYLITQKYLVNMPEQALIPIFSALANRVRMMTPFNKA